MHIHTIYAFFLNALNNLDMHITLLSFTGIAEEWLRLELIKDLSLITSRFQMRHSVWLVGGEKIERENNYVHYLIFCVF